MLGIRRYLGVQIDLYQGDLTRFVCDAVVLAAPSGKLVDGEARASKAEAGLAHAWQILVNVPSAAVSAYQVSLHQADALPIRHLCFPLLSSDPVSSDPASVSTATETLAILKQHLDQRSDSSSFKRVTFVLPSMESYISFQQALFQTFPESN